MERMKVAFVTGRFRAETAWKVELNIRAAEEVALALWKMGLAVICPHTNTRFFDGSIPNTQVLAGDLVLLGRSDVLVAVAGWSESEGAKGEVEAARAARIPIFQWPSDRHELRLWLDAQDSGEAAPAQLPLPFPP